MRAALLLVVGQQHVVAGLGLHLGFDFGGGRRFGLHRRSMRRQGVDAGHNFLVVERLVVLSASPSR